MPDKYDSLRTLPFLTVAAALGWDTTKFKTRKNGAEHFGPCNLHGSKSNQACFSYHQDGRYACFSCSAKGRGSIDLIKAAKGLGFQQSVEWLQANVSTQSTPAPAKPVSAVSSASQDGSSGELKPFTDTYRKHQVDCPWLYARVPKETCERFGVYCYANPARRSAYSGRVMLPFRRADGTLDGYTGRLPEPKEGEQKYLVPTGFPKSRYLFGLHELLPGKKVYLVESAFSVMHFAGLGVPALGLYGWSVSDEQLAMLKTLGRALIYLPDANKTKEAEIQVVRLAGIGWVKFPVMPVADPELLSLEQINAL